MLHSTKGAGESGLSERWRVPGPEGPGGAGGRAGAALLQHRRRPGGGQAEDCLGPRLWGCYEEV